MILRAGFVTSFPLTYPMVWNNKVHVRGNLIQFINLLKDKANISTEFKRPSLPGWTGLMKMLIDDEAEMSLSPLALKEQTMNLKMSKTIFYSSYILMSKKNDINGLTDLTDQYTHLCPYFWLLFIACIPLLISFGALHSQATKTVNKVNNWNMIRILLNQVYVRKNRLNSVSAMVSLYILCYTLIRISIDSLINVSLIVSDQQNIDTLEDILKAKTVLPAIYKSTNLELLLQESNDPVHRKIWSKIKSRPDLCLKVIPNPITAESVGFDRKYYKAIRRGQVVSFEADYTLHYVRDVYCRKVSTMRWHISPPLDLLPLRYVFGFSKRVDNQVIKMIDNMIEHLLSSGMFNKWFNDDRIADILFKFLGPKSEECIKDSKKSSMLIPVNFSSFARLSFIASFIIVLSIIILIFEIIKKIFFGSQDVRPRKYQRFSMDSIISSAPDHHFRRYSVITSRRCSTMSYHSWSDYLDNINL